MSDTKFCKHCGEKIAKDAVVCNFCGRQVEELKHSGGNNPGNIVINNSNNNQQQQQQQQQQYGNPYAHAPLPGMKLVDKTTNLLLCFFLGWLGAHKFYEGKPIMGLLYLFTGGLFMIGVIIDFLAMLAKPSKYYV